MSTTKEQKQATINDFRRAEADTGSPEVQVALLTSRISELTDGKGADVIYDPVGGPYAEPALRALAWRGRFLVVDFPPSFWLSLWTPDGIPADRAPLDEEPEA